MMLHLASGCEKDGWLCSAMAPNFASARQVMTIEDNCSKNRALFHFANTGTDVNALRQLRGLRLQPSVLLKNEYINKTVMEMTKGVSNLIQSAASVSNFNDGPNFLASLCFTEATGCTWCAINYPLLNMTYSSKRHLAPLCLLSYMSLATLHATGISAEEVQGLSDPRPTNSSTSSSCSCGPAHGGLRNGHVRPPLHRRHRRRRRTAQGHTGLDVNQSGKCERFA